MAADHIARLAAGVQAGDRIGSKDDIRHVCGFSVGTADQVIKIAQERGIITSRPGPGGGIFAADPSALSRMNGWFRSAASDYSALDEAIQIRDALASLLVDEVLARITDADQSDLNALLIEVRRTRDAHDLVAFVWAIWNVHEHFAGIGRSQLLNSLYLSIMDVGTSHLRARLEAGDETGRSEPALSFSRGLPRSLRISSRLSRARDADGGCRRSATYRPRNDFGFYAEHAQQAQIAASGLRALLLRGWACVCAGLFTGA